MDLPMNHKNHKKTRLYARKKKWESTELYLCECGAVLEKIDKEVEVQHD